MMQHAKQVAAKWSALKRLEMLSANLAIGTASVFVLATAAASLAVDRDMAPTPAGGVWSLRGSLAPADMPPMQADRNVRTMRLPAKSVVARLS